MMLWYDDDSDGARDLSTEPIRVLRALAPLTATSRPVLKVPRPRSDKAGWSLAAVLHISPARYTPGKEGAGGAGRRAPRSPAGNTTHHTA